MNKNSTITHEHKGSISNDNVTKSNAIEIPHISLPKGGGALKGIDEKFQINPANGTASFSIPLALSSNRNGFTPSLALSYNSGNGNSLFGIGWELNLPCIQRQTDKKLPRYRDTNDLTSMANEDSFMFSGVEELVPALVYKNDQWHVQQFQDQTRAYTVRTYRPRIEGSFSRIERIHSFSSGYYWRVTTKDNVTTFFGYSESCRIADPQDKDKVFMWLPEFSFDDKGSYIWYEYKAEDLTAVVNHVHERNRFGKVAVFSNKHISKVKYGNAEAYYPDKSKPYEVQFPQQLNHHFELVFDYGEYDVPAPKPTDNAQWNIRTDAFSFYRSGFEMRTYRLCKRVLMFHTFSELNGGNPTLTRSLDFEYESSNAQPDDRHTELNYLIAITQKGYVRKSDGSYSKRALPKMVFNYQRLKWNNTVTAVSKENITHAPAGLSGNYQWVDLYSEGINGILCEEANSWFYKSNLGRNNDGDVHFTHADVIIPKPSFNGLRNGTLQLQDLDANGQKQIVSTSPVTQGYFELSDEGEWQPFKNFIQTLNLNMLDPNVRMLDVNGDGKAEILLADQGAFWWWESKGRIGYDTPELAMKSYDEEKGAAILFAGQEHCIFLADMSGDGLTDIVRIHNNEICYWPNIGYGKFGAKVTMSNAPRFDHPDSFNPAHLILADITGTGVTDIIYLGKNKFSAFLNLSGNAWSNVTEIEPSFPAEQPNRITVTDLFGNGTSCIVWSSSLPAYSHAPMRYIDLMGGVKPHIIKSYENGFGKKTEVQYKSSSHYYLQDKVGGEPWVTKLAFPVQCVSKLVVTDATTRARFTTAYSYHHGYYDHAEREFRGFGRVEQIDTEDFEGFEKTSASNIVSKELHQSPVLTKTWYHTGAFIDQAQILTRFKNEYWYEEFKKKGYKTNAVEYELPDASLHAIDSLTGFDLSQLRAEEWREAHRACKGMILRQEIFALDAASNEDSELVKQATPYSVATHNCKIRLIQPRDVNKFGVFTVEQSESLTYHYERTSDDPRISHTLTTRTDEYGNVLESVSVVYPRIGIDAILTDTSADGLAIRNAKQHARKEQKRSWLTFTKSEFTNDIIREGDYQLRKAWQTRTYELTGFNPSGTLFSIQEFNLGIDISQEIEYHHKASEAVQQKRLIEHIRIHYYDDELLEPLPEGLLGVSGVIYENYQLAYTANLLQDLFTPSENSALFEVTESEMQSSKYLQYNTNWWIRSGIIAYRVSDETLNDVRKRFYVPIAFTDPFGSRTEVFHDATNFFIKRVLDAGGNEAKVLTFNFRTLSPVRILDANDNITSIIIDELGLLKATALEGKDSNNDKVGEEGDNLTGYLEQTDESEQNTITAFFQTANQKGICSYAQLQSIAYDLLQNASARTIYDFSQQPAVAVSVVREQHAKHNPKSVLQISFEYTSGLGKDVMKKVQAEPGTAKRATQQSDGTWKIDDIDSGNQLRWVGTGRRVLNNKGNPIKQYEPYFSVTPGYENASELVESGVTSVMFYDAVSRLVKTEMPNGTYSEVIFDSWKQIRYDANDTAKTSSWYSKRTALADNSPEKRAALKAAAHSDTPSCTVLDSLGRPVLSIEHNRVEEGGNTKDEFYYTFSTLDIEGNVQSITDARGNGVMQYRYDMLGHRVVQISMDAGKRWIFNNAIGNPVKTWDERKHEFSFNYDALHRLIARWVKGGDEAVPLNHMYEKIVYGEGQPDDKRKNIRGRAAIVYDTAGKILSDFYDFKGNLLKTTRIFAKDYKHVPDWSVDNRDTLLEGKDFSFTTTNEYDALNRAIRQITPDGSTTITVFNPAGLLNRVDLKQGSEIKPYVKNIDYDAKGQRTLITYGNDLSTRYQYEPDTFRISQIKTAKQGGEVLQDLKYTYDPIGNIIQIEDKAIPVTFFNNQKVAGRSEYTYDALYQLVSASGREQNSNSPTYTKSDNWDDAYAGFNHTNGDSMAMRVYTQLYRYDSVGNILEMRHQAAGNGSWTRDYVYESKNNRLKSTTVGSDTYQYPHNPLHGFIVEMPHLQRITWTFKEELRATTKQLRADGGTPEITYYVYDGKGKRVRKVTENQADSGIMPTKKDERLYIDNFELYRNKEKLERESLHITDGKQRISMVDTETVSRSVFGISVGRSSPKQTIRYQSGNHLSSVCLETDDKANVISYEEYHPYGTTAYVATNSDIKASAKRYRYTAKERDEETGFYYYGARYYSAGLARWINCDPAGLISGTNVYQFVVANPITLFDPDGMDWQESNPGGAGIERSGPGSKGAEGIKTQDTAPQASAPPDVTPPKPPPKKEPPRPPEPEKKRPNETDPSEKNKKEKEKEKDKGPSGRGLSIWPAVMAFGIVGVHIAIAVGATAGGGEALAEGAGAAGAGGAMQKMYPDSSAPPVSPPKQAPPLPADSPASPQFLRPAEARATFIHNSYGRDVLGTELKGETYYFDDSQSKLGSRIVDHSEHIDAATNTAYEINTTPWEQMSDAQRTRKIEQVGKDFQLIKEGKVSKVVWVGSEPLPNNGFGAELKKALANAGIEYRHIPMRKVLKALTLMR